MKPFDIKTLIQKCDEPECCCKCAYQYVVYPFSAAHFHHVGGFMCTGINSEDDSDPPVCSHFRNGHGLCELFYPRWKEIYYDETHDGELLWECLIPGVESGVMVGSLTCRECRHNYDFGKGWIICKANKNADPEKWRAR